MKTIFAALAVLVAALAPWIAHAQGSPAQWNYTSPGNVATATYPGNVVIDGTMPIRFSPMTTKFRSAGCCG